MEPDNNLLLQILYAIQIPAASSGFSFPNEYDLRLIEATPVFDVISRLPKDLVEVICNKENAIRYRLEGIFDGHKIAFFHSPEELENFEDKFKVVFLRASESPPLESDSIVTSYSVHIHNDSVTLELSKVDRPTINQRILAHISKMDVRSQRKLKDFIDQLADTPSSESIQIDMELSANTYSAPMIGVLKSLRASFKVIEGNNRFLPNEIILAANSIIYIRNQIIENLGSGTVSTAAHAYLTDLSSNLLFLKEKKQFTEANLASRRIEKAADLIEAIKYSNRGGNSNDDLGNSYIDQLEAQRTLLDRLITLAAANEVCPVIKLPLNNSMAFAQVDCIGASDRGDQRKIDRMMTNFQQAISSTLGPWLEYFESIPSAAIKLISNLPLEWAAAQGLPLMIRHEVSRIPVTPGHVASKLLLDSRRVHLAAEDFSDILFISSFAHDDRLRNDLKNLLEQFKLKRDAPSRAVIERLRKNGVIPEEFVPDESPKQIDINIKWFDVSNKAELFRVLEENRHAITVFDLHGSHDSYNGGVLHLRDEVVFGSEIAEHAKISPIVILSACDTSPVDASHNSIADALFSSGAKALISSALPINSADSARFVTRLLERLRTYLPIRLFKEKVPVRWSSLISGMARRTYFGELVDLLQRELKFGDAEKSELLLRIFMLIDPLHPTWAESIRREIINRLGVSEAYLTAFMERKAQFFECLKYLQLGRPEQIIVSGKRSY